MGCKDTGSQLPRACTGGHHGALLMPPVLLVGEAAQAGSTSTSLDPTPGGLQRSSMAVIASASGWSYVEMGALGGQESWGGGERGKGGGSPPEAA